MSLDSRLWFGLVPFLICLRCRNWFLSWAYSPIQFEEAIQSMVSDFSDDTFADVESMLGEASGWMFQKIIYFGNFGKNNEKISFFLFYTNILYILLQTSEFAIINQIIISDLEGGHVSNLIIHSYNPFLIE